MKKSEEFGDIHGAEVLRAIELSTTAIDNNTTLDDIDDMLVALIDIVEGKTDFAEFAKVTNTAHKERLN